MEAGEKACIGTIQSLFCLTLPKDDRRPAGEGLTRSLAIPGDVGCRQPGITQAERNGVWIRWIVLLFLAEYQKGS